MSTAVLRGAVTDLDSGRITEESDTSSAIFVTGEVSLGVTDLGIATRDPEAREVVPAIGAARTNLRVRRPIDQQSGLVTVPQSTMRDLHLTRSAASSSTPDTISTGKVNLDVVDGIVRVGT